MGGARKMVMIEKLFSFDTEDPKQARLLCILQNYWKQTKQWAPPRPPTGPAIELLSTFGWDPSEAATAYLGAYQNNKLAIEMWLDQCENVVKSLPLGTVDTYVGNRRYR